MVMTHRSVPTTHFRPYIYVETSARFPASVSGSAATALQQKYLEVAEAVIAEPPARQLRFIQRLVRAHFAEHHGACPLFGAITGYVYRCSEEESIALTTDGTVRERSHGRFDEDGKTVVYLNDKPMEVVLVRY
jgi:hypothetical protein